MARQARKYKKRIEIFGYAPTPDGFGGNVLAETSKGKVWCDIRPISVQKLTTLGLDVALTTVEVFVRRSSSIDYQEPNIFFTYKSKRYTVTLVRGDFDDIETQIIATNA